MEWVETTGRTLAEAVDAALDELGVHEDEAEIEVVAEGKAGILGRFGAKDARVRARVKPVSREKRPRRGGSRDGGGRKGAGGRSGRTSGSKPARGGARGEKAAATPTPVTGGERPQGPAGDKPATTGRSRRRRSRRGSGHSAGGSPSPDHAAKVGTGDDSERGAGMTEEMSVGEQAEVATEFVRDLVEAFGSTAEVKTSIDDDVVSIEVGGDDLGLLVGPGGNTLRAIEELTRTVVARRAGRGARIRVDIGGYQAKRREALAEFTQKLARRVVETGKSQALEPMPAPDRKVVHDAAAEIDGVETVSDGEDPRRRVIIRKA